MASREGGGTAGGGATGEARAAQSVLGAPSFRTPTIARAESASGAVARRWAPDGDAALLAPSMRSLRFADERLVGYLGGAERSRRRRVDREAPSVSWLFPIPWFGDELEWMAAAQAATAESWRASAMEQARSAPPSSRASAAREEMILAGGARPSAPRRAEWQPESARPVPPGGDLRQALDRQFDLPLELIAPSLAAGSARASTAGAAPGSASQAAPWRAYTPLVDGAAARAAELLASLAFRRSGAPGSVEGEEAARPAPLLSYVTPVELAAGEAGDPAAAAALAGMARRALDEEAALRVREAARQQAAVERAAPSASRGTAASTAGEARARAVDAARLVEAARVEQAREATARATEAAGARGIVPGEPSRDQDADRATGQAREDVARSLDAARAEQASASSRALDVARAIERAREDAARGAGEAARESAGAEPRGSAADASGAIDAGAAAVAPPGGGVGSAEAVAGGGREVDRAGPPADAATSGARAPLSARARALELLAVSAASGQIDRVAPAAGPRVLMPAGLGGLVAATAAARAVHLPTASMGGQPAPGGGEAWARPVGGGGPAALGHVLWADRWLARFAGASPAALGSFDAGRTPVSSLALVTSRSRAAAEWAPSWVAPRDDSAARERRASLERAAASAPALSSVVVDDDEPVSDSVFGAIAAAAAAERMAPRGAAGPHAAERAAAERVAAARSALAASAGAPGAGAPAGRAGAGEGSRASAVAAPYRVSLADRALGRVAVGGSAGLGASLAASPMAAVLAGLIEVAPQAVFDARPLAVASLREFLARGAIGGRSAAGPDAGADDGSRLTREALLDRLAGRAPGSIWLALPGAGGPAGAAADPWRRGARGPLGGVFAAAPGSLTGGATPYARAAAARSAGPDSSVGGYVAAASSGAAAGRARSLAADAGASALADAEAAARELARSAASREAIDRVGRRRGSAGLPGVSAWSGSAADLAAWSPWTAAGPGGPGARRPGQLAVGAESFSHARSLAAADLSLDFLSPEILAAARAAGVGPIAAGRAQRIAASGRPHLAALAAAVDRVFVEALSPALSGQASPSGASRSTAAVGDIALRAGSMRPARAAGAPLATAGAGDAVDRGGAVAAPGRASLAGQAALARALGVEAGGARVGSAAWWAALSLGRVAPVRAPRGAFLLPDQAARFLGVRAGAAEEMRPDIGAALELVAASEVAEAASGPRGGRPWRAGPDAVGVGPDDPAASRASAESARAQLPRELWSVFDAVYLSLDDAGGAGPLAPSARAARALAVASRATSGSPGAAASARARAAAAWAVLPVVLPGGAASGPGAARARQGAGALAGGSAEARARGAGRAGQALASLVAPTFLVADRAGDAGPAWSSPASSSGSREPTARQAPEPTFVSTSAPREAPSPPPPAPSPPPRPSEPPRASPEADMAWFYEAAQKYFADAGPSSSGLSVAEMTLVTAAPRAQVAASPQRADRPVTQAASTAQGDGDASKPGAAPAAARPDVDKIAQEVFEQVCRMIAVARERSGDPWQR